MNYVKWRSSNVRIMQVGASTHDKYDVRCPVPTVQYTPLLRLWCRMNYFKEKEDFFLHKYGIPHCFICRHSDSIVSEDAGSEPRIVETLALAVRSSNALILG